MVSRVYVEKLPGFDVEAHQLASELRNILQIEDLDNVRLINRYDVEGISEELFAQCVPTVFSEPQSDRATSQVETAEGDVVFAVEFLPGQFDQRADSASECIQLISQGERPAVRSAKVYVLSGSLTDQAIATIKHYVINPVEAREASLDAVDTLKMEFPEPPAVEILDGFLDLDQDGLAAFIADRGLAMDLADITFCQEYFASEKRNPTITEIKVIDTYWSDHCRHTTFGTVLDEVTIDDPVVAKAYERYLELRHELGRDEKPICLMDLGTIGAKYLKHTGDLTNMDESDEINACTVKVKVDVNGQDEDWLYLFKNETHNHPTEIEPFGGAATCVGGAIRDPLSGRSYVYQAMRVTGAADPTVPVSETIPGKLPQRKLVTTAAAGYSSYGNQIGLATGQVNEVYHPGYAAKRMEIGAVVGATPAWHVRRETPCAGDAIILLGGRTGRDGIGGATGSSKAHSVSSIETCGAEVQKGNAPVERKLQRLFRRGDACKLIKRCNDFGAGGVSVATGEIADGLDINLDLVPKKYEGLDGTELAIAESQERMACAVAAEDVQEFLGYAREENLEATVIATVTEEPRLVMKWRGDTIVNVTRAFLNSNGAPKHATVHVQKGGDYRNPWENSKAPLAERMNALVTDLNIASNKGLSERFDSTIGAATVLMPFGGKEQLTPSQAMVAKLPVDGETTTVSGMAWGYNPYLAEKNQFTGAYLAVVESICKLAASGFARKDMYLTFQEYFGKLRDVPERWGMPAGSLLGALMAQLDLKVGSIGGKDSMSGTFEDLDVPPTLVSFATALGKVKNVTSPEFKKAGSRVLCVMPDFQNDWITPEPTTLVAEIDMITAMIERGDVLAAATPGYGATAEALFKMCVGNRIGVNINDCCGGINLFGPAYGCFVLELADGAEIPQVEGVYAHVIGETTEAYELVVGRADAAADAAAAAAGDAAAGDAAADAAAGVERVDLAQLQEAWESAIEGVFAYRSKGEAEGEGKTVEAISFDVAKAGKPAAAAVADAAAAASAALAVFTGKPGAPRVIIPVFPGTNCEFDTAHAFERAGAKAQVLVVNNLTPQAVAESTEAFAQAIRESQIIMIPGGFSGGDEPDGSAKFITAFFRAPQVTEAVRELLQQRDGLMLGICNGFQALVKLGLVPFGDIREMDDTCPTLTFNNIGRHQSRLVRTRIATNLSPWLSKCQVGDIHTVAISHGEGRFVASPELLAKLIANGQVATQYVDEAGVPSLDLRHNPNGSVMAIEGICSPDGRVLGKMGHTERSGAGLYKNVPGNTFQPLIEGGVSYFL